MAQLSDLRQHRAGLLACEAIGLFHMAGKARMEFLLDKGGSQQGYNYQYWHKLESPPFDWDALLDWVKQKLPSNVVWPNSIAEFTEKHAEKEGSGTLSLLQAAHGITSGIEKNIPRNTSEYLRQKADEMWLSSPFGYPKRNLVKCPPPVLACNGWQDLLTQMRSILVELKKLADSNAAITLWSDWRRCMVDDDSPIRKAFLSTLAETRLPNNDVTLWDQSYVAAALFKSAMAGAVLKQNFEWQKSKKFITQWRLLTVGFNTDLYERRAIKIGDWMGVRSDIEDFFAKFAELVEVDLAVGSLLYRDTDVAVFSFPEQDFDKEEEYLRDKADNFATSLNLETPPYLKISKPTRSLVPLIIERREVTRAIAIPIHKPWRINGASSPSSGHVCPVCHVRLNGDPTDRDKPCGVCGERRSGRAAEWLKQKEGGDTIWFSEVSDSNRRLAVISIAFDLDPWLEGQHVDSLRAQSIAAWRVNNPVLGNNMPNPIDCALPYRSLCDYIKRKLPHQFDKKDVVLCSLHDGYSSSDGWKSFYAAIVEDRADAPKWDNQNLSDDERAAWLTHQLFRKLPSPGRVYRFWRETEDFFRSLLGEFQTIAREHSNLWRCRRLLLKPKAHPNSEWDDLATYSGEWRGKPLSAVYVKRLSGFVTISNLAQLLAPNEEPHALGNTSVLLRRDDDVGKHPKLYNVDVGVEEIPSSHENLRTYSPTICLDLSPFRFRVIVPLERADDCVSLALGRWEKEFARVWDRLPLYVGVVGFEEKMSFQAVIEAVRNVEAQMGDDRAPERWTVLQHHQCNGVLELCLERANHTQEIRCVPIKLPDGRDDDFYPYVKVAEGEPRAPRDFCHPNGWVYRHMADLEVGDSFEVAPSRVNFMFMISAGSRFEIPPAAYAADYELLRRLWRQIKNYAPSKTAVQQMRIALGQLEEEWSDKANCGDTLYKSTLQGMIIQHLGKTHQPLIAQLTNIAERGLLIRLLDWHFSVLKEDF